MHTGLNILYAYTGAIGGIGWSEITATAEIEVDGDKGINQEEIVAVECPDIEFIDPNNACSSNILKLFSPEQLSNLSSKSSLILDNQRTVLATKSAELPLGAGSNAMIKRSKKLSGNNTLNTKDHFLPLFLAVEEESLADNVKCNEHEKQLLVEYKTKEIEGMHNDGSLQGIKGISDNYEKVFPKHGDVFLYKMTTIISRNPGQVIR